MTACTTISGLLPMAAATRGGAVGIDYTPLGRAVVGGLLSSTLLTLIAVPLFYTLLDDLAQSPQRIRALLHQLKPGRERAKRGRGPRQEA